MISKTEKQPKVFYLLSFVSLFDRLSFYVINFSLILATQQLFGFSVKEATVIVGVYGALAYLIPVIGGYASDRIFGIKNIMLWGIFLETIGYFCLGTSGLLLPQFGLVNQLYLNKAVLYLGLAMVVFGSGIFKTTPTNVIGRSYNTDDPRIDSAFTFYYMIINIGGLTAGFISGYAPQIIPYLFKNIFHLNLSNELIITSAYIGWVGTFYVCFIFAFIGLLLFISGKKLVTPKLESVAGRTKFTYTKGIKLFFGSLACIIIAIIIFSYPALSNWIFGISSTIFILYIIYEIIKSPKKEGQKILVATIMIIIAMVFFILYNQLFMSITLFIDKITDRDIFGITIPTLTFIGCVDPIWIIVISFILTRFMYPLLHKTGKEPHITTKFALGVIFAGVGFLIISASGLFPDSNYKVNILWPTVGIGVFALGELLISALGVAMVTKIVPKRLYGFMMGAWYLISTSFASILAADISNLTDSSKSLSEKGMLGAYSETFLMLAILGVVAGIFALFLAPLLRRVVESD